MTSGPDEIIGDASCAKALGIDPDPATGGADGGVTCIVFPGKAVDPTEDHQVAQDEGAEVAQQFVDG